MTFDPFGDFEIRGYLRNFASLKDISQVKDIEYASFQGNISRAINALASIDFTLVQARFRDPRNFVWRCLSLGWSGSITNCTECQYLQGRLRGNVRPASVHQKGD